MIKLKQLLFESGKSAGKVEVAKTPLDKARNYTSNVLNKVGRNIKNEFPNFDKNYTTVYNHIKSGKTQRKDMPAIDSGDIIEFQYRLSKGYIDISKPHAPTTNTNNPFPTGLTGKRADDWLEAGLKRNDGADSDGDDKIPIKRIKTAVGDLKPIQKQVYLDKSIHKIGRDGAKTARSFLGKSVYIVSSDNYIIDGHHRYLTAMLIDPTIQVNTLSIDLPLSKLLPLATAYGDAIGNKRNA
jgi:hypothetical protein